jgi:hypothetical protein
VGFDLRGDAARRRLARASAGALVWTAYVVNSASAAMSISAYTVGADGSLSRAGDDLALASGFDVDPFGAPPCGGDPRAGGRRHARAGGRR